MDYLKPADMPAVLERTKLKVNEENFLLPIYEAISNGIYSAQGRWGQQVAAQGKVSVSIKTGNFQAIIADNGLGLDEKNYAYFLTPFTGYRLQKGGKGFGRFIAFKVFEDIVYTSKFLSGSSLNVRSFKFDIYKEPQIQEPEFTPAALPYDQGCVVRYQDPKTEYDRIIEQLDGTDIVERIIRYFLPFFLSDEMPELSINVDGANFDARSHFSEFFSSEVEETVEIDLGDEIRSFEINISKVKRERLFKEHMALLFADGRVIGAGRKIAGKIGNSFFEAPDGSKQIYIASVRGKFLDERANTARTEIEATSEEIDAIVQQVTKFILGIEKDFVKKHRSGQAEQVGRAVMRNPLLRSGLKGQSLADYVDKKPMSWKAEDFVSDLALMRFRDQNHWEKEFSEGLKTPEKLVEMRKKLFEQLDEENKDALASYVAHRKSVLELADTILGMQEDGKMSLEDIFHDLVYPRYEDSDSTVRRQINCYQ